MFSANYTYCLRQKRDEKRLFPLFFVLQKSWHQKQNDGLLQNREEKTLGVDFTIILNAAFTQADPKSAKNTVKRSVFFVLLRSERVNASS